MIETPRLILRPWCEADRLAFWEMAQDAEVMRNLGALTRAQSDHLIDRMVTMQAEHGHCFWAIERKSDARFLGFCGVILPREPTFEYELGWRIVRDCWGIGMAREAAEATIRWSWEHLPADTLVAITVPGNGRSWGLMERLGMERDASADFDNPRVAPGDPLRPHILYRIRRPRDAGTATA